VKKENGDGISMKDTNFGSCSWYQGLENYKLDNEHAKLLHSKLFCTVKPAEIITKFFLSCCWSWYLVEFVSVTDQLKQRLGTRMDCIDTACVPLIVDFVSIHDKSGSAQ